MKRNSALGPLSFVGLALFVGCSARPAPLPPRMGPPQGQPPWYVNIVPNLPPAAPPAPELPPIPADLSAAAQLRDRVLQTSKALDHVKSLVDEVGPRLAGSDASPRAVNWGVAKMKELGLVNVHTEDVKETHWVRGKEVAEITSPSHHVMAIATLGGSVATPEAGIDAEVIEVDSVAALADVAPEKVKGKIVFFHTVMEKTRDGSGYGHAVGSRYEGANAASKKGAVASLVRTIGTSTDRAPHTGAMKYADGVNKIPAGALSVADAEVLHRLLADGKTVKVHLVLTPKDLPLADGSNVVGEVRGTTKADEIVLLGAHLDSWDLGMGALDDGAGDAIILESARQIALFDPKPKRTVRVVLFANEENGLAGAKAYGKAHEAEMSRHYLAAEADLGDGRVYEVALRASPEKKKVMGEYTALLFGLGAFVSEKPADGGSDIGPLRQAGVPILELRQDATRYFDIHHSANDVVEEIQKDDLDQATASFAAMAYAFANRDDDLGRIPESERTPSH